MISRNLSIPYSWSSPIYNAVKSFDPGSVTPIKTPGKLIMQHLQEIIFSETNQVEKKGFLLYSQLDIFTHDLPAAVKCTDYLVGTAFYLKRNDIIIGYKDGPDIQIMRRNRCDQETSRVRKNDRSITA